VVEHNLAKVGAGRSSRLTRLHIIKLLSFYFILRLFFNIGVLGFEPRNNGVKVRCLTAWRYPILNIKDDSSKNQRFQPFTINSTVYTSITYKSHLLLIEICSHKFYTLALFIKKQKKSPLFSGLFFT
jgi:hypothetical protein